MADMSAFTGLPIEELIGGPLIGAAKGQAKLAQITMDFVNQMAFQEDGVTAKLIPVIVDRLVKNPDTGAVEKLQQVSPITLVEIPNFSMQDMEIEFSMEVKQSSQEKSATENKSAHEAAVKASVGYSGWGVKVKVEASYKSTASVSASKEQTRGSDFSAKYHVKCTATQKPPTEGMSRFTQILASAIEPIETTGTKPAGG
jgi:hypothetical protein